MKSAAKRNTVRAAVSAAASVACASFRCVVVNSFVADALMLASAFLFSCLRLISALILRIIMLCAYQCSKRDMAVAAA